MLSCLCAQTKTRKAAEPAIQLDEGLSAEIAALRGQPSCCDRGAGQAREAKIPPAPGTLATTPLSTGSATAWRGFFVAVPLFARPLSGFGMS
jgi:hypothetical protein